MAKLKIDKDVIRDLAELLNETGLTEIEWSEGDVLVRIGRETGGGGMVVAAPPAAVAAPAAEAPAAWLPSTSEREIAPSASALRRCRYHCSRAGSMPSRRGSRRPPTAATDGAS